MTSFAVDARMARYVLTRDAQTLLGICAGISADGMLSDAEIAYLRTWLSQNVELSAAWPGSAICSRIDRIMADGVITDGERADLLDLLQKVSGNEFADTGSAAPAGPAVPYDEVGVIDFAGRSFCLTGTFFFGTRAACEQILRELGAIPANNVTKSLDYLVVGGGCSEQWANTTYGRKIETALERKQRCSKPAIISEQVWASAVQEALR